jgi:hypothetical protein
MKHIALRRLPFRRTAAAAVAATVLGGMALLGSHALAASSSIRFALVPGAGIAACLPHASGQVSVQSQGATERMRVEVSGMPPNTDFDLFVIQQPGKPFGISWYQSDLHTNGSGRGSVEVVGRFNVETFSVSPGGATTTFPPTHMYHLGLWFNDPAVPFQLGCEPGKTAPVVTPFNGEQHAGIQVLNTSTFPDAAGPLSQLH